MAEIFEEHTERITARITPTLKTSIEAAMKKHGMKKISQYIKLAVNNQVKADKFIYPQPPQP